MEPGGREITVSKIANSLSVSLTTGYLVESQIAYIHRQSQLCLSVCVCVCVCVCVRVYFYPVFNNKQNNNKHNNCVRVYVCVCVCACVCASPFRPAKTTRVAKSNA
jgi:hypothetical protein